MSVASISPRDLFALSGRGEPVELLDVRTPAEFREVHVPMARNVPLDMLDPAALLKARSGSGPLYCICKSGGRSSKACEKLVAAGGSNVVNVEGGTTAWVEAGLPAVRGKKTMSLERQVRIVAGSLVVLGSALSFWHPAWIALSAFVGAGLVFAGITDTCGMAMLLARLPWNRAGEKK